MRLFYEKYQYNFILQFNSTIHPSLRMSMVIQDNGLKVAEQWINAWNHHALEKILAHYTEDIRFVSPLVTKLMGYSHGRIQGKTALREYFTKGLTMYPNLKFDLLQTLTGMNSLVICYRTNKGALVAEFMTLNGKGLISQVSVHYSLTGLEFEGIRI